MKYLFPALLALLILPINALAADGMLARTSGYVLLQVESHGEAWYVNPDDGYRYYMKDGATAYQMMRTFGLGISNADLQSVQAGNAALIDRLKGHILLQVEEHGEAYYIHPGTGEALYMPNGEEAYNIMRYHSLGITDADLSRLVAGQFSAVPYTETVAQADPVSGIVAGVDTEDFHLLEESGDMPEGVNVGQLNSAWLSKVNAIRSADGVDSLSYDADLVPDLTLAAQELYMQVQEDSAYADELIFTENPHDTWDTVLSVEHVFTISYDEALGEDAQDAIENVLSNVIGKEYPKRHQLSTIVNPHWQATAVGFYFFDKGDGNYTVYSVHQYAR